jgi:hypothetical protein
MEGDSVWLAYRTKRADHFAVLRFSGVTEWTMLGPVEAHQGPPVEGPDGVEPCGFHEVESPDSPDARHWRAVFPDETLDVIAHHAQLVARAIQALDAESALSMVHA